jgi:hypothetical protein
MFSMRNQPRGDRADLAPDHHYPEDGRDGVGYEPPATVALDRQIAAQPAKSLLH